MNASMRERTKFVGRLVTHEDRLRSLAMAYGSVGVCLAIILLIVQIEARTTGVLVSLWCAAVALPLWLGLALSEQLWMVFKLDSDDLSRMPKIQVAHTVLYLCCALVLVVAVGALVFSQSGIAGMLFATGVLGALALVLVTSSLCYDIAESKSRKTSQPHS